MAIETIENPLAAPQGTTIDETYSRQNVLIDTLMRGYNKIATEVNTTNNQIIIKAGSVFNFFGVLQHVVSDEIISYNDVTEAEYQYLIFQQLKSTGVKQFALATLKPGPAHYSITHDNYSVLSSIADNFFLGLAFVQFYPTTQDTAQFRQVVPMWHGDVGRTYIQRPGMPDITQISLSRFTDVTAYYDNRFERFGGAFASDFSVDNQSALQHSAMQDHEHAMFWDDNHTPGATSINDDNAASDNSYVARYSNLGNNFDYSMQRAATPQDRSNVNYGRSGGIKATHITDDTQPTTATITSQAETRPRNHTVKAFLCIER